ncbi:MAG: GDP-fucose synthetase [Elusimicrobia bacterium RIFOXYD12_FULL_66_9]|nr:MAG: GDP-fucose synthetase [Elusimicrobia bacterium RIFOXYD12_FULL_66_9]
MVGRNLLEHPEIGRFEVLSPSSRELDLLDHKAVEAYLRLRKPDVIIHAAGRIGGIQANLKEPVRFLMENLDMGRNIVLAARSAGVKRMLSLGSSSMYPRNAPNPLQEEVILMGELDPTNEGYALAKIVTARLCEYATREDPACQYKTLILCNVYGRHDSFDPATSRLVSAIIHKIHEAKTSSAGSVQIWGDGTARREFLYAGDLAGCLIRAVERFDSLPQVMNVGAGDDLAINDYYKIAAEVIGYRGAFHHDVTKPAGMMRKLVSTQKAQAWGWRAETALRDGIAKTYDYYLQMRNQKSDPRATR